MNIHFILQEVTAQKYLYKNYYNIIKYVEFHFLDFFYAVMGIKY